MFRGAVGVGNSLLLLLGNNVESKGRIAFTRLLFLNALNITTCKPENPTDGRTAFLPLANMVNYNIYSPTKIGGMRVGLFMISG